MLPPVQDTVWAFDCEWVPDPDAGRKLYNLPPDLPDAAVVQEMWKKGGATEEDPYPFLKTILCRVVSIAVVQRRVKDGKRSVSLLWLPRDPSDPSQTDESKMVGTFLEAVGRHHPQLVGFNSQGSDLRVLVQRAVVKGIAVPDFFRRPGKPWEGMPDYLARSNQNTWNVDLMELVGGWGSRGAVSLHELAVLSNIPGKFQSEGHQVALLWLAGQWKAIVDYNCCDAVTTYLLWLRLAYITGQLTKEQYEDEQEELRQVLMDEAERSHGGWAEAYLEEWDRLELGS